MNPKLFEVCVGQIRQLTPRVREYLLTRVDGKALPTWTAGAHIALHLVSPSRGLLRANAWAMLASICRWAARGRKPGRLLPMAW